MLLMKFWKEIIAPGTKTTLSNGQKVEHDVSEARVQSWHEKLNRMLTKGMGFRLHSDTTKKHSRSDYLLTAKMLILLRTVVGGKSLSCEMTIVFTVCSTYPTKTKLIS